jgi:hypothetical protein
MLPSNFPVFFRASVLDDELFAGELERACLCRSEACHFF